MYAADLETLQQRLRDTLPGLRLWFGKEIPRKKLAEAIRAYAAGVVPDRVLAMHDATVFGGADAGFLVTDAAFYCRNFSGASVVIRFDAVVSSGRLSPGQVSVAHGGDVTTVFSLPTDLAFNAFWDHMRGLRERGLLASEDRYVIVQDMSPEFRTDYVKIAVLLTMADDGAVDAEELSEVQLLMTRLELPPTARREVLRFAGSPAESPELVLQRLVQEAPRGAWPVLQLSVVKDLMIVARRRQGPGGAAQQAFVAEAAARCGVGRDQLAVIGDAIAFDDAVLSGKVKASRLKQMGTDLAAKAGAVGVPLAAVYLSGSVIGLGAAGITSGLSALGFGGLFGLSAMVTGIGTVLVLGVAVFQLVRWLSGNEDKELAALRERLMQEVAKQLQRTINALLVDLQLLSDDVVDLTRQAMIDEVRIRKLAQDLSALLRASRSLTKRREEASSSVLPGVS